MLVPGQVLPSRATESHLEAVRGTGGTGGTMPTSRLPLIGTDRVFCSVTSKGQSNEAQWRRDVVSHVWAETLPGATKEHLLNFTLCHPSPWSDTMPLI